MTTTKTRRTRRRQRSLPDTLYTFWQARRQYAGQLRRSGLTLQSIGDRLGVTRERVRQLVQSRGRRPGRPGRPRSAP
jgi:hypothetical protein